jgi:hypothetical protein
MNLLVHRKGKRNMLQFLFCGENLHKISAIMQRADPPPLASIVESSGDTILHRLRGLIPAQSKVIFVLWQT